MDVLKLAEGVEDDLVADEEPEDYHESMAAYLGR